ncbi:MAG: hypothetical protein KNN13_03650 [Hydrogenobacter thermophilus]|uniref:hypothetical protein n=1 Tax=Hydrogenobacter thermophilus TaxID=940 RepID=UPI001C74D04D|nr:hypothetical protein [Hydrogenobacter thermophilus]QWK20423.1 MAG: hypothetical protein KNN13_03650 [Hydrogenobacter thermophilus]
MPSQFEKYRFTKKTVLSDETFNKIFKDIDLRITALEDIKKDWTGAVEAVTRYGLQRIEEVLRPSWEHINNKKTEADNLVAQIQQKRDNADAIINTSRDDVLQQIQTEKIQALNNIQASRADAITAIQNAKTSALTEIQTAKNNALPQLDILAKAFQNDDPTTSIVKRALQSDTASYAQNADTVDGYHASLSPAPNVIVPLNADGVLDLSATYVKSHVYTFRRVDLTNATSDYNLQVGEEAIINFTNATSVPLRIATSSGTLYNLYVYLTAPSFAQGNSAVNTAFLLPNNTSITNAFYYAGCAWGSNGQSLVLYGRTSAFVLIGNAYLANCFSVIYNEVNHKSLTSISVHAGVNTDNYARWQHVSSVWNDYSTQWTSLGTITFPISSSGYILVRRLA